MRFLLKYFICCLVFLLLVDKLIYSQADKNQFTQYPFNKLIYNPAYAGDDSYLEASAFHRSQWVNLSGRSFSSQTFSFHLPLVLIQSGAGLSVANDFIGAQRSTIVMGHYAYKMQLDFAVLSLGLSAGIIQSSLDGTKLRAPEGDYSDLGINHSDDFIPASLENGIGFDAGAGVYLSDEKWYAGISVAHLTGSKVAIDGNEGSAHLKYEREYYLTSGYKFNIGNLFKMEPSFLLKSDLNKIQVDLTNLTYYKDNIWFGVSFRGYDRRSFDALGLILGFHLTKNFIVNYSYDVPTSFKSSFNDGSHEFSLLYRLKMEGKGRKGSVIYNPRFL